MAFKKLLFLAAFLLRCFSATYADPIVSGPTVALGTDYFQTQPGTQFNFGPGIGIVGFRGLPIGPFSTDTIVQRQADALINGPAIPIQITALSLQSMQPVMFNGNLYHVFVTLDPAHLLQDTGTLSVQGTLAGGTFDSVLNIFFLANFVPIAGGPAFGISQHITLSQTGAMWSPAPRPGSVIVGGPDDGSAADKTANRHSGLDSQEVDFFPFNLMESHGNQGRHIVRVAVTPEPNSLLLIAPALGALFLKWRMRRH